MSLLIDTKPTICNQYNRYHSIPAYKLALSVLDVLGNDLTSLASLDDADKFQIMNESGTARNLAKVNISNSIYEDQTPDELQNIMSF